MASTIEICNRALTKIGSARILTLGDDVKAAQTMNAIYDLTLQAELAAHPWVFAMARAQLPALSTAPAFGWSYAYQLPADCLRLVEVGDNFVMYPPDTQLFELEGSQILCNESSPLKIKYVKSLTNAGLFTALFADSLACRLAAEGAEDITQNASKRQQAEENYKESIRVARRSNAIQLPPRQQPEDAWVLAHRGLRG